ncbi:ribosome biogenesis protein Nop16 [Phascolomyces articulosus]|uniref:Nucleolar protein 16 n=1 Tax=Phascolomyces articulosus TaxID=60185 RepID=A0AAD5PGC3_9FUNG|nr:ribosome biogenesis protein Nop16 [Phascolomyces articulosus]
MATPQKRKAQKSGRKNTRRTADKRHKYKIQGNAIIKQNWDKKQTLIQNYKRLGLMTSLNGKAGGIEKLYPDPKPEDCMDQEEDGQEERELTEEDIAKLETTLKPGEGLIQRDDEGNVIRVIVGRQKTHDEILEEEPEPVEAKTDVVRQLEEQARNAHKNVKYQSTYQQHWIAQLMDKHGDDYKAMFWDTELNQNQMTANQLKKKCAQFLKQNPDFQPAKAK